MDFGLTDEQNAIADLATAVFADYCSDEKIARFEACGAPFDTALWRQLQSVGLLALALPEPAGDGLGALELMQVLVQQGRFLAPVPLWRHQIAALAVATFGHDKLKAHVLSTLADGAGLATVAENADVSARRTDAGWLLDGSATAVAQFQSAAYVLVPARDAQEQYLFLLSTKTPGIITANGVLTHGEPVASLRFEAVAAGQMHGFSAPGIAAWLDARVTLCLGALQLGVAEESLSRTARYVSEREQFGRIIGSFQAVAQRMADAYTDTEILRTCLWNLASALDHGRSTAKAAYVAKYWAAQCGHRVSHAAQHLHGGLGADVAYPLHRFFLWSRALEISGGGASRYLARLGDVLARTDIQVGAP